MMRDKNFERTECLALVLGYNELAKGAKVLGQKVYMRMARNAAHARFVELGGKLTMDESEKVILEVPGAAYVRFYPRDIEMMRECVRMFDRGELPMAKGKPPPPAKGDRRKRRR